MILFWKAKLLNACSWNDLGWCNKHLVGLIILGWSAPMHHLSVTCTGIIRHSRKDSFDLPWCGIYSQLAIFQIWKSRRWLFWRVHCIQDPSFLGYSENDEQHVVWGDTFSPTTQRALALKKCNFVSEVKTQKISCWWCTRLGRNVGQWLVPKQSCLMNFFSLRWLLGASHKRLWSNPLPNWFLITSHLKSKQGKAYHNMFTL